jgi:hypothetical protein
MDRLDRQIRKELRRFGPVDAAADASGMVAIVRAWPAAVGETVARNAWPARLTRDGTLHVHASSATWAYELGRMASEILERLRAEAGADAPPALRFAPGPIPEPAAEPAEKRAPTPPEIAAEDRVGAAEIASSIEDHELRETVARAVAASLARTRSGARSDRGF